MDTAATYDIIYLGIGGVEECETHIGHRHSLAETITFIEERGGQQITATRRSDGRTVYECGGLLHDDVRLLKEIRPQ